MEPGNRDTRGTVRHVEQSTPTGTVEDLRVLDLKTTADLLGVSTRHLRDLTAAGAIGHVDISMEGSRRPYLGYLRRHIDAFLASRESRP